MTLKELYEQGKEIVYDVICDYIQKKPEFRLAYSFEDYLEELTKCPMCEQINERDYMTYHKWDIGQVEELICEGCREDE